MGNLATPLIMYSQYIYYFSKPAKQLKAKSRIIWQEPNFFSYRDDGLSAGHCPIK